MIPCLGDFFARRLEVVWKTSWRWLEDVLARRLKDVLKMSWKRLEDIFEMYDQEKYTGLNQDVLKMSSEDEDERYFQNVFKMSSSRRMFTGLFLWNYVVLQVFYQYF